VHVTFVFKRQLVHVPELEKKFMYVKILFV